MPKKQTPLTRRENAKAIARWEGEGGARTSPSDEERDSGSVVDPEPQQKAGPLATPRDPTRNTSD